MKQKIIIIFFTIIVSIPMFIYGSRYISNIPIKNIHKKYSNEVFTITYPKSQLLIQIINKWYFSNNFRQYQKSPTVSVKFVIKKKYLIETIEDEDYENYYLKRLTFFNNDDMLVTKKVFRTERSDYTWIDMGENLEYYCTWDYFWYYSYFDDETISEYSFKFKEY